MYVIGVVNLLCRFLKLMSILEPARNQVSNLGRTSPLTPHATLLNAGNPRTQVAPLRGEGNLAPPSL